MKEIAILISLLLIGVAGATIQPGDFVRIGLSQCATIAMMEGNITEIGNGLVCLNCTFYESYNKYTQTWDEMPGSYPVENCITVGDIVLMRKYN